MSAVIYIKVSKCYSGIFQMKMTEIINLMIQQINQVYIIIC